MAVASPRLAVSSAKASKGGRPWADDRKCCEGILWILSTGAPWSEAPRRYGSSTTCWQRLSEWSKSGVLLGPLARVSGPVERPRTSSARPSGAREQSPWYSPMARVLRSECNGTADTYAFVSRLYRSLTTIE